MKLLIITQVLDKNHPILGFFHRWVEEFSLHYEKVIVICLEKGGYNLPTNVSVYSLGKEEGKSRLKYLVRFYSLIFSLRKEYNSVFVHMNQIYVILGTPFWRVLGKKVGLWYAHGSTPFTLRIAEKMTNVVFTSTPEGFVFPSKKLKIVGQGIDTSIFKSIRKDFSETLRIITVGRISSSKNIDTLLEACALLRDSGVRFKFQVVGIPTTESERLYDTKVKKLSSDLSLSEYVEWVGAVPNFHLPTYLQNADIFIHDGATNSLDKTLIEASLCGCTVISSNPAYKSETEKIASQYLYSPKDAERLAEKIKEFNRNDQASIAVQQYFKNRYDISILVSGIVNKY